MAGKGQKGKSRKGKKGKGRQKKVVDEYQLRRNLREQSRIRDSKDQDQEVMMAVEDISQYADQIRIGGIEGGGTHSTLVILDGKGTKLTEIKGPDTNHWVLGIEETAARISAMIERGKESLSIPESTRLDCVASIANELRLENAVKFEGLSLSGCEEEKTNRLLTETLLEKYPNAAKAYLVSSDTLGSLRTALEIGGIVAIAGTGSNALLVNPDGKTENCGGWSYMMGDEGSAYWIAHRACKYVFDDIDDLVKSPEPINYVWPAMRNFFNVPDRMSMLPLFYTNFDKRQFATFTKEIVIGCEKKDPLCLLLFYEAGQFLAKHVIALAKKAHSDLKFSLGGLKVICVGSVWKSWKFMEKGFANEFHNAGIIQELSLLRLTASSALGASYLAAEKLKCPFVKPYEENAEVFYHYKRDHYVPVEDIVESIGSDVCMVPCDNKGVQK